MVLNGAYWGQCDGIYGALCIHAAALLACRAYGAVCCLYFLSLTIPMQEIIMMLGAMHLPPLIIELMYLIYRYIFLLLDIQHRMTIAASSRLGYASLRSSWFSFTHISGNLLAASFSRSNNCLDAMDARCYNGRLRFLTHSALPPAPCRPLPNLPAGFQRSGFISAL